MHADDIHPILLERTVRTQDIAVGMRRKMEPGIVMRVSLPLRDVASKGTVHEIARPECEYRFHFLSAVRMSDPFASTAEHVMKPLEFRPVKLGKSQDIYLILRESSPCLHLAGPGERESAGAMLEEKEILKPVSHYVALVTEAWIAIALLGIRI